MLQMASSVITSGSKGRYREKRWTDICTWTLLEREPTDRWFWSIAQLVITESAVKDILEIGSWIRDLNDAGDAESCDIAVDTVRKWIGINIIIVPFALNTPASKSDINCDCFFILYL